MKGKIVKFVYKKSRPMAVRYLYYAHFIRIPRFSMSFSSSTKERHKNKNGRKISEENNT